MLISYLNPTHHGFIFYSLLLFELMILILSKSILSRKIVHLLNNKISNCCIYVGGVNFGGADKDAEIKKPSKLNIKRASSCALFTLLIF